MEAELNGFDEKVDAKWVKTESGEIYLCPVAILDFIDELSEKDLKSICVQESIFRQIN